MGGAWALELRTPFAWAHGGGGPPRCHLQHPSRNSLRPLDLPSNPRMTASTSYPSRQGSLVRQPRTISPSRSPSPSGGGGQPPMVERPERNRVPHAQVHRLARFTGSIAGRGGRRGVAAAQLKRHCQTLGHPRVSVSPLKRYLGQASGAWNLSASKGEAGDAVHDARQALMPEWWRRASPGSGGTRQRQARPWWGSPGCPRVDGHVMRPVRAR
jgi:hypothetical protein